MKKQNKILVLFLCCMLSHLVSWADWNSFYFRQIDNSPKLENISGDQIHTKPFINNFETEDIYAKIQLQDGRILLLKTDSSIQVLLPNDEFEDWNLDAYWEEGEDNSLIIFTGEGTSYLSILDDYIYEGYYHDGLCWNEEWVGGEEGSDEGGLEDVGYYPEPSKGEKFVSIKFYKNRDEYREINRGTEVYNPLSIDLLLDEQCDYLSYKEPEDIEKGLENLGFSHYSERNVEVEIGSEDTSMIPGVEKTFDSPGEEVIFIKVIDPTWTSVTHIKILFRRQEAQGDFIANLKKHGWVEHKPFSCDAVFRKKGFSIYFTKNEAIFDDGL